MTCAFKYDNMYSYEQQTRKRKNKMSTKESKIKPNKDDVIYLLNSVIKEKDLLIEDLNSEISNLRKEVINQREYGITIGKYFA